MRINKIKRGIGSRSFDMLNIILMVTICFLALYPIWYVLIHSFNDGNDAVMGGIYWLPREFSLENYRQVFRNNEIVNAFFVSVMRTLIATAFHVVFTGMVAYAFLNKKLIGRKLYMNMGIVTMFFSGGLIPSFILAKNLGLVDNFWVYVFPTMFNFFDLIIFQSFFRTIPGALEESAMIDGANQFTIFFRVIMPLSKPVFAVILLFNGVYNWNDFFMGVFYIIKNSDLHPIQTYLYKMIVASESSKVSMFSTGISQSAFTSTSLQMATMIVTTVPIVVIYPFLQKYFVKGMLLGSVKE